MKRQWRIGRIVLAVILVGIAVPVWFAWPQYPLWVIPNEKVLGFDLVHRLLYTVNDNERTSTELHGFALDSGLRVVCTPIFLPRSAWSGLSSDCWYWCLSVDGALLAAIDDTQIAVFALPSGKQLRVFHNADKEKDLWWFASTIAFSDDSRLLALRDTLDKIIVWDLTTGLIVNQFNLPKERGWMVDIHEGPWVCAPYRVQISSDHRFLAVKGQDHHAYVYELPKVQLLGCCDFHAVPHFMSGGREIVFVSDGYVTQQVSWYDIANQFQLLPRTLTEAVGEDAFVTFTDDFLITASAELPYDRPTEWLSASWRASFYEWLFKEEHWVWLNLRFWDLRTGRIAKRLRVKAGNVLGEGGVNGGHYAVSQDGRFLAVFDGGNHVVLWDTEASHPLKCWLVCGTIMLIGLCVVWPCKTRVV